MMTVRRRFEKRGLLHLLKSVRGSLPPKPAPAAELLVDFGEHERGPVSKCQAGPFLEPQFDGLDDLFFAVLFGVCLHRVFRVISGVCRVAPRGMCMVRGLLMVSSIMMFRSFPMMARGVRMVFGSFLMVFGCFFGHAMILLGGW